MRLEGKRSLVTGAQQGIGRAAVLALAREGANVAINWFEGQDAAEELATEVRALQRRAVTVHGDVSNSVDVTRFVDEAHRALGGINVLINNAGVFPRSPFLDLTDVKRHPELPPLRHEELPPTRVHDLGC
jgi:NAD(P)-dependent dehydrogenase (short-subunit alcohol dehydrogenase family)